MEPQHLAAFLKRILVWTPELQPFIRREIEDLIRQLLRKR
jgi:hypothetical protein